YYPADYYRGDLNHLPFADASFDVVVSLQSFQYLDHPAAAIRQIARVLKPGGHFLLTVPNGGSFKNRLQELPAIQRQTFDRETVNGLLSDTFQIREISTRGLWLPFPKIGIHLPGTYRDSLGLSWTTVSERLAGK
ncbi:MAG: class I SAM-dependent methyltransferase, partial [Terriglobales bacterium]